jgi:D-glycero-alpha-D-manno-heptose-7-phosphate kinase
VTITTPRVWRASAPVRTADVGGWTDTWFAGVGAVCNIALDHRAQVVIAHDPAAPPSVRLSVAITDECYTFEPGSAPGRHPIIEHAISMVMPPGAVEIAIGDEIEPGSGLGTSAAVLVALVAGLLAAGGAPIDPADIAARAHRYETFTGKQSGIQDHWASAFGGISLLDVEYPTATRSEVVAPADTRAELARRLHTVYLGLPHASSALHDEVIGALEAVRAPLLDDLRHAARAAAMALTAGDLDGYGRCLLAHHEAMRRLHPLLIGEAADELAQLAGECGALGWKVNGAGGTGGSMVVLGPSDAGDDAVLCAAIADRPSWRLIDAAIGAPGVWVRQEGE